MMWDCVYSILGAAYNSPGMYNSNSQAASDCINIYNAQAAYGMQRGMQLAQLQNLTIRGNEAMQRTKDCEGCGAPLKAYIHHCEYCRRAAC